jgi:hypothetical protein
MKIETKDYHWTCGEPGCCDEYGTILYIDGKEVEDRRFGDAGDAYRYILEELQGHEIDYIYEDDEPEFMGDGTFADSSLEGDYE